MNKLFGIISLLANIRRSWSKLVSRWTRQFQFSCGVTRDGDLSKKSHCRKNWNDNMEWRPHRKTHPKILNYEYSQNTFENLSIIDFVQSHEKKLSITIHARNSVRRPHRIKWPVYGKQLHIELTVLSSFWGSAYGVSRIPKNYGALFEFTTKKHQYGLPISPGVREKIDSWVSSDTHFAYKLSGFLLLQRDQVL